MAKRSDSNFKFALLRAVSLLLPTEEQTWLLRACLWSGERGAQAWTQWSGGIGDAAGFLRAETDGVKGLLPLLFHSLQNKKVLVAKAFQTYLRTAYARDELRSKSYSRIGRAVTSTLTAAGIPTAVLKGAALAETAYENPTLQHAHFLDILIQDHDLTRTVEILRSLEFACATATAGSDWRGVELVHESGLPLIIHRRLFRVPFYNPDMEEIWTRSQILTIAGAPTRLLSPADNLMHICGSLFDVGSQESLRWACDAWFLVHRYPDLDWEVLLNHASRGHMGLQLFVTVGYLAEQLNAPVPAEVLNRLGVAASKSDAVGRELALFGVLRNARGGLIKVLQNSGDWSTRALVTKCALFPSPQYVRWFHEIRCSWLVPFYYPYRPLKFIVRQIFFFCKRRLRLYFRQPGTDANPTVHSPLLRRTDS